MHIREYQQWLKAWDSAREWDKILPSHVMLHAIEELGEVSKLVQMIEGYRVNDLPSTEALREELELELSDLVVMLFKIAYLCQIDMEEALARGQRKADERFPDPKTGPADRDAYWRRFRRYVEEAELDSATGSNR
ncbi:MAG: hypothetical protein HC802_09025 [Caldilineaceae bacterium]|nr:hypothetical protein [Caldilineaceae bacterium]